MSWYFSAEDGARKWLMSRAMSGRKGPNGAVMTSGSLKRSWR